MLLTTFHVVQALLVVAGLVFLYQCTVFAFYFGRGLTKGENGITLGLLVLYSALLLGGLSTAFDASVLELDIVFGPFSFLAMPESHPTPYLVIAALIHLLILIAGCIGNHLLYFALRKAR